MVDPGVGEAVGARRHVIVVETLRDVQQVVTAAAQVLADLAYQVLEIGRGRLVGADVLGRVNRVKADAQLAIGGREAAPVDIRQDHQAIASVQAAQGLGRVRERRPATDRAAESPIQRGRRPQAVLLRQRRMHSGQHLRVRQGRRFALDAVLERAESGQCLRAGNAAAISRQQRLQGVPDTGFPVDQRAVTVETENVEFGQALAQASFPQADETGSAAARSAAIVCWREPTL